MLKIVDIVIVEGLGQDWPIKSWFARAEDVGPDIDQNPDASCEYPHSLVCSLN